MTNALFECFLIQKWFIIIRSKVKNMAILKNNFHTQNQLLILRQNKKAKGDSDKKSYLSICFIIPESSDVKSKLDI